jgi:molecular chaperone GrpE
MAQDINQEQQYNANNGQPEQEEQAHKTDQEQSEAEANAASQEQQQGAEEQSTASGQAHPAEGAGASPQDANAAEDAEADEPIPAEEVHQEQPSLEDQLKIKEDIIQSWEDKYNRLQADFDNFRKRTQREKQQLGDQANRDLLATLLPAIDDLDRALQAAETAEDVQSIREGLQMVDRKLKNTLHKQGVEVFGAAGDDFDVNYHEAIASQPVEDESQKGKVIEVVQKGYMFKDQVIRFAKVITGE